MKDHKVRIVLSVRLFTDEKCFGPGVATLLRKVKELHSLRAAAMDMNMAYSKAWTIIKKAEQELGFRLLNSTTGGRHGGGATLTEKGARLVDAYDGFCRELQDTADRLYDTYFAAF